MKKEVTIVPKDKCPLDVLAELGERTKNAWIFLHDSAYDKLRESASSSYPNNDVFPEVIMDWHLTTKHAGTKVSVENQGQIWERIITILAEDIAFTFLPDDPEEIFFLKMAE